MHVNYFLLNLQGNIETSPTIWINGIMWGMTTPPIDIPTSNRDYFVASAVERKTLPIDHPVDPVADLYKDADRIEEPAFYL
jgi:hypothetical protein